MPRPGNGRGDELGFPACHACASTPSQVTRSTVRFSRNGVESKLQSSSMTRMRCSSRETPWPRPTHPVAGASTLTPSCRWPCEAGSGRSPRAGSVPPVRGGSNPALSDRAHTWLGLSAKSSWICRLKESRGLVDELPTDNSLRTSARRAVWPRSAQETSAGGPKSRRPWSAFDVLRAVLSVRAFSPQAAGGATVDPYWRQGFREHLESSDRRTAGRFTAISLCPDRINSVDICRQQAWQVAVAHVNFLQWVRYTEDRPAMTVATAGSWPTSPGRIRHQVRWSSQERSWAAGYRAARALRAEITAEPGERFTATEGSRGSPGRTTSQPCLPFRESWPSCPRRSRCP